MEYIDDNICTYLDGFDMGKSYLFLKPLDPYYFSWKMDVR